MPQISFGEWLPDRARIEVPGLRGLRNMFPTADGYTLFPGTAASVYEALDKEVRGANRFRLTNGTSLILAGTETDLWAYTSPTADNVTRTSQAYLLSSANRWDMDVFGNTLLACNGIDIPQARTIPAAAAFDNIDVGSNYLNGAPVASVGTVHKDFYILGNVNGTQVNNNYGPIESAIHWSSIGNPKDFPPVGTTEATNSQSGLLTLEGDGGPVTAIVSAGEYALVFRERQVWRMDYTGPPTVWSLRKLDEHRGCVVPGSAFSLGGFTYYLAEDGFSVCDGARIQSVGFEKVDRTFLASFNSAVEGKARVSVAHDPDSNSIMWAFPTAGTKPDTIYCYNYDLQRWWNLRENVEWLLTIFPIAGSLDAPPYADADMDNDPIIKDVDLDTLRAGDIETLAAFNWDHEVVTFDSNDLRTGFVETGDFKDPEGARLLLRSLRPEWSGAGTIQASAAARIQVGDDPFYTAGKPINPQGRVPIRVKGRYLSAAFQTVGEVEQFQGFDPFYGRAGKK